MRTTLLVAAFVANLVLGTAISFAQQGAAPANVSGGTNAAVIDIGYIIKNFERFKLGMEDLKRDDEAFQKEFETKRNAINASIERLQSTPKTSPEYKTLEEQIASEQTKLRLDMARKQKERVEDEAKLYYNAYQEIEYHVAQFATQHGIDIVLRFNSEEMDPAKPESVLNGINRFVVWHKGLDITGPILGALNPKTPPRQPVNPGPAINNNIPPRQPGLR